MTNVEVLEVSNFVDAVGTSLQGYVMATYAELEAVFSKNLGPSDKVFNEFRGEISVYDPTLECHDVYTVTLYDWKEDSPLTARTGTYRWHVGGFCSEAPYYVEDVLEAYRNGVKDA
jgi:hypothetical protein